MINTLLSGVFKVITSLVNVLLTPINLLISNYLPELSSALGVVRNFFTASFTYIGWVVDSTFISSETISLLIAVFTMKLLVPLAINTIKLAIKWYHMLVP